MQELLLKMGGGRLRGGGAYSRDSTVPWSCTDKRINYGPIHLPIKRL